MADQAISSIIPKKPARYRRAISYDSKEYYMRLASGNPAVFQDAIEENTVGETAQQEPEHGEDTIARATAAERVTPAQTVSEGRSREDTRTGTHIPAARLGERPAQGASQP